MTGDDLARVYAPFGHVAHLLRFGDSANDRCSALCGDSPAWFNDWRGTGSQSEYEKAAVLPVCRNCAKRVAA